MEVVSQFGGFDLALVVLLAGFPICPQGLWLLGLFVLFLPHQLSLGLAFWTCSVDFVGFCLVSLVWAILLGLSLGVGLVGLGFYWFTWGGLVCRQP